MKKSLTEMMKETEVKFTKSQTLGLGKEIKDALKYLVGLIKASLIVDDPDIKTLLENEKKVSAELFLEVAGQVHRETFLNCVLKGYYLKNIGDGMNDLEFLFYIKLNELMDKTDEETDSKIKNKNLDDFEWVKGKNGEDEKYFFFAQGLFAEILREKGSITLKSGKKVVYLDTDENYVIQ